MEVHLQRSKANATTQAIPLPKSPAPKAVSPQPASLQRNCEEEESYTKGNGKKGKSKGKGKGKKGKKGTHFLVHHKQNSYMKILILNISQNEPKNP